MRSLRSRGRADAGLLALVALVGGCDIAYGVHRTGRLDAPVDVSCIPRALARVPGVTNVEHRHVEPNTWSWPHPSDTIDQYLFAGENMRGVIEQAVAHDGAAVAGSGDRGVVGILGG